MALLKDTDQEHKQDLLSLELNLLTLETYAGQTTEGWLKYSLTLRRQEKVIARIDGTLHDNDLRR